MPADNLGDWRFSAATRLAKDVPSAYPGGPSHKAGTPVYQSMITRNSSGHIVAFNTPSAVALALNIAFQASTAAVALKARITYRDIATPLGGGKGVETDDSGLLFDYFQQCMVAVTFSFQSLEAFCNQVVSRTLVAPLNITRKSGSQSMDAADIERYLSTDEKLATVLPQLLGIQGPKGTKLWQRYNGLKKIRDSTIHLKSEDQYSSSNIDRESLFFQFLNHHPHQYPRIALEIVEYFERRPDVRWLNEARNILPRTAGA